MQRMPARVFAALLASDAGALTSAELGEQLRISPAAVSGAVRYLAQRTWSRREREPGSRRDRYRVHSDQWYEALTNRDGASSSAGRRPCAKASTASATTPRPAAAWPRRSPSSSSSRARSRP